jgi:cardiolipin synthase (CMP-forming)
MHESQSYTPLTAGMAHAWSLPNLLTYGRILAVPALVACFYLESTTGRWLSFAVLSPPASPISSTAIWRGPGSSNRPSARFSIPSPTSCWSTALVLLVWSGTIGSWSLLAALVILAREISVSGLREFLAGLQVSVPVSWLAKWKTTMQMVAIAFLLIGPAGDHLLRYYLGDLGWSPMSACCSSGYRR